MTSNNQTNEAIRWAIIVLDFLLLNILVWLFCVYHYIVSQWAWEMRWVFLFVCNLSLLLSELRFSTVVHQRIISAGEIVRRVVGLVCLQALVAYVLLKGMNIHIPAGKVLMMLSVPYFGLIMMLRYAERWAVKRLRLIGRNTRTVTFVGNDPELLEVYEKLVNNPTRGYKFLGYYADGELGDWTYTRAGRDSMLRNASTVGSMNREGTPLKKLGSLQEFLENMSVNVDRLKLGDDLFVSLSRRDRDIVRNISNFCDHHVIRFYYVPVSVESLGMNLKREQLDDMEIYTTYENPLENPVNRFVKRTFDIVSSLLFLLPTAIMFPFIYAIIKIQSPGPIFFRQKRTGLDGKEFDMLKFRSMHVNADADKVQATKDDPRKYPFGNFMRRSNIDELPQFLNVLKGDMSFVGPRPHMLLHTEQYSQLIDKYMVRHFVKPGLTGWAQVTGFRGETKELWQMEGRVKRDIWYIEHWSIWLDIRIIWMTFKTIFVHDEHAY